MTGSDNNAADVKWRGNNVEGEDSWRTASCLRGRLLAERMASRNAREEAHHLGIRLVEVERQLKQEVESRNKAERKLKLLMKRLECMNISYEESVEEINDSQLSLWSPSSTSLKHDECCEMESNPSGVDQLKDEQRIEPSDPYSGALVTAEEHRRIDPEVLDATVKQVLESLGRAKEQLLSSMEKRRRRVRLSMTKVV